MFEYLNPCTFTVRRLHDGFQISNPCIQVRGRKLHAFTGGFRAFMEQRDMRDAQARATAAAQQKEIDK